MSWLLIVSAIAGVVTLAAGATAIGVVGATMIMWLPRIAG